MRPTRKNLALRKMFVKRMFLIQSIKPVNVSIKNLNLNLLLVLDVLNREQNVTLILVTHALDLAARMQRQFQLLDGKLLPEKI